MRVIIYIYIYRERERERERDTFLLNFFYLHITNNYKIELG